MHDIENIERWFQSYKRARENFDVLRQDIWNYDETGFHVEVGEKQTIIVTKHCNAKLFHEDADDREHLTVDEFICGDSDLIDSFVIMKGIVHLEKFYFEGGFTPNTSIDLSESGYLINELAIPLLEHFDARTSKSTTGQ